MKKILLSLVILLFSSAIASADKQKCRELPLGKEYFNCIKGKVGLGGKSLGLGGNSSSEGNAEDAVKDDRSWYQKIKDGKPLLSKD